VINRNLKVVVFPVFFPVNRESDARFWKTENQPVDNERSGPWSPYRDALRKDFKNKLGRRKVSSRKSAAEIPSQHLGCATAALHNLTSELTCYEAYHDPCEESHDEPSCALNPGLPSAPSGPPGMHICGSSGFNVSIRARGHVPKSKRLSLSWSIALKDFLTIIEHRP